MTTTTHLSHFDITHFIEGECYVFLSGSLGACKRMAAAHGLEVVSHDRPGHLNELIGLTGASSIRRDCYPGGYTLMMPVAVWKNS